MAQAWTLEPAIVTQIQIPIEDPLAGSLLCQALRAHTVQGHPAKTIEEALRPFADLEMAALRVGADAWSDVCARHPGETSYWSV